MEIQVKDRSFLIRAREWKNQIWFHLEGRVFVLDKIEKTDTLGKTNKELALSAVHQTKDLVAQVVRSPMPGQIIKVLVKPGMKVVENQTLIVLSSMKMEYVLKSDGKGLVQAVHVREGETVSVDQVLVKIS